MSFPFLRLSWNRNMRQEIQEMTPDLFLGSGYSATNVKQLEMHGITNLIRVFDSRETQAMVNFVAHRKKDAAPGLDKFEQNFVEINVEEDAEFVQGFSKFESFLLPPAGTSGSNTRRTLVYCTTGIAVSPPFVVMLLMKRLAWNPVYAMEYVCDRRACVYFTEPAQQAIMKFADRLSFQAEMSTHVTSSKANQRSRKRKRVESDSEEGEKQVNAE